MTHKPEDEIAHNRTELFFEKKFGRDKGDIICGVDEVGRGPLCGPVITAAVILPPEIPAQLLDCLDDSKRLTAKRRETAFSLIQQHCDWAFGSCSVEEIDQMNILQASLCAMGRAVAGLSQLPNVALIDGNKAPKLPELIQTETLVKGDARCASIAAASIIAKVNRDRLMAKLGEDYPDYGWAKNAGYGTKQHKQALLEQGPTPHHRKSFKPVQEAYALHGLEL